MLEHIEDELHALRELRASMRPGGTLLVTVPAYQWLWSEHDDINHHKRRYTRATLSAVAAEAGWMTEWTTYFNGCLLPAAAAHRRLSRLRHSVDEPVSDLELTPVRLNALLRGAAARRGVGDRPRLADPGRAVADGGAAQGAATGRRRVAGRGPVRQGSATSCCDACTLSSSATSEGVRGEAPRAARSRRARRCGPSTPRSRRSSSLSGLLEFVRLGQNGFANVFYSAAVKSMLRSWHKFFFAPPIPTASSPSTSRRSRCGCRR